MEKRKIQILNVRLPLEITSWVDSMVKNNMYNSRSEAVRNFIREYVRTNRE